MTDDTSGPDPAGVKLKPEPCWIICRDLGSEGLAEPFIVFAAREDAEAVKATLDRSDASATRLVQGVLATPIREPRPGDNDD